MITGNEPVYPQTTEARLMWAENEVNANPEIFPIQSGGKTLRQEALLRFMCGLIQLKNPEDSHNPALLASIAEDYTTAYINQLNKTDV